MAAPAPEEGMASLSLTVDSLPYLGLSSSLSGPQFLYHKIEELHRVREDICNVHIHNVLIAN